MIAESAQEETPISPGEQTWSGRSRLPSGAGMPETGTFLSTAPHPPMVEHPDGKLIGIGGILAINTGLDPASQAQCSSACLNSRAGTAGKDSYPASSPRQNAPDLCEEALCRANEVRNEQQGLAQSYINSLNRHCSQPGGAVRPVREYFGTPSPDVPRAPLCTPSGCLFRIYYDRCRSSLRGPVHEH